MASGFLGFVALEGTLYGTILTRNTSNTPTDSVAVPGYRVYGPQGLMASGTGSASLKDSGTITGATNATPVVISSTAHGLTTGTRVTISGVLGNTGANTSATITYVSANTFSLDSVAGTGAYTSGGTFHVAGLYGFSLSVLAANGYAAGTTYTLILSYTVGSTAMGDICTFIAS